MSNDNDSSNLKALKLVMRTAIRDALLDLMSDDNVFAVVNEMIQEELDESYCWLEFDDEGVTAFVGIGDGDVLKVIRPVGIEIESYANVETAFPDHLDDLRTRLVGLDKFLAQLQEARDRLNAEIQSDKWKALP